MRAMPDSKSAGNPLFLTWLPFPSAYFFKIYFLYFKGAKILNGVTVVYEGKTFGQTSDGQTKKGNIRFITFFKQDSTYFFDKYIS